MSTSSTPFFVRHEYDAHDYFNSFKNGSKVASVFAFLALGSGEWGQFSNSDRNDLFAIFGVGSFYLLCTCIINKKFKGYKDSEEVKKERKKWLDRLDYLYQLLSFFDFICLICKWAGKNLYKIINSKIGLLIGVSIFVGVGALFLAGFIADKISSGDNNGENNWDKTKEFYRSLKNGRHFANFMGELAANAYWASIGCGWLCGGGLVLLAVDYAWKGLLKSFKKDASSNIYSSQKKKAYILGSISGLAHGLYLYQFYWVLSQVAFHTTLSFATGGGWGVALGLSCALWGLYYMARNFKKTYNAINKADKGARVDQDMQVRESVQADEAVQDSEGGAKLQ